MVVGARRTGLCEELQCGWVFPRATVLRVYQEWSTTQRTSSQLDTTVGSTGVNMGQHPCGMLSTPCRVHALIYFSFCFITFPVGQFTYTQLVFGSIAFLNCLNLGQMFWVAFHKLPTISWMNFGPFLLV